EQQIAQLGAQLLPAGAPVGHRVHLVQDLVRLLQQVRAQGAQVLLAVPRTARPVPAHHLQQPLHRRPTSRVLAHFGPALYPAIIPFPMAPPRRTLAAALAALLAFTAMSALAQEGSNPLEEVDPDLKTKKKNPVEEVDPGGSGETNTVTPPK